MSSSSSSSKSSSSSSYSSSSSRSSYSSSTSSSSSWSGEFNLIKSMTIIMNDLLNTVSTPSNNHRPSTSETSNSPTEMKIFEELDKSDPFETRTTDAWINSIHKQITAIGSLDGILLDPGDIIVTARHISDWSGEAGVLLTPPDDAYLIYNFVDENNNRLRVGIGDPTVDVEIVKSMSLGEDVFLHLLDRKITYAGDGIQPAKILPSNHNDYFQNASIDNPIPAIGTNKRNIAFVADTYSSGSGLGEFNFPFDSKRYDFSLKVGSGDSGNGLGLLISVGGNIEFVAWGTWYFSFGNSIDPGEQVGGSYGIHRIANLDNYVTTLRSGDSTQPIGRVDLSEYPILSSSSSTSSSSSSQSSQSSSLSSNSSQSSSQSSASSSSSLSADISFRVQYEELLNRLLNSVDTPDNDHSNTATPDEMRIFNEDGIVITRSTDSWISSFHKTLTGISTTGGVLVEPGNIILTNYGKVYPEFEFLSENGDRVTVGLSGSGADVNIENQSAINFAVNIITLDRKITYADDGIQPIKIAPIDVRDYLGTISQTNPLPLVFINHYLDNASIRDAWSFDIDLLGVSSIEHRVPASGLRYNFYQNAVPPSPADGRDSATGMLIEINGEVEFILLGLYALPGHGGISSGTLAGYSGLFPDLISAINAELSSIGFLDSVSTIDFSTIDGEYDPDTKKVSDLILPGLNLSTTPSQIGTVPIPSTADYFEPPTNRTIADTNAPILIEATNDAKGDQHITVAHDNISTFLGNDFGKDTRYIVYYQRKNNFKVFKQVDIVYLADNHAIIRIPPEITDENTTFLLWAENRNGFSKPLVINKPKIFFVESSITSVGETIYIVGCHLSSNHGTKKSWALIEGNGTSVWLDLEDINPYCLTSTVPQLDNGTYNVWVYNGHAGEYGWSNSFEITIQDHYQDLWVSTTVNVKDYGATGDGTTDDSDAIWDAIEACPDYGIVYFPDGEYKVTGKSSVTNNNILSQYGFRNLTNKRVHGQSKENTIISGHTSIGTSDLSSFTNAFVREIKDITFDYETNMSGSPVMFSLVTSSPGGSGAVFNNVLFKSLNEVIRLDWINEIKILNCEFQSSSFAIRCRHFTRNILVDNCVFKAKYEATAMIQTLGTDYFIATNNTVYNFDDSDEDNGDGWGQGRWFISQGTLNGCYIANNTTVKYDHRTGSGAIENNGEKILFEAPGRTFGDFTIDNINGVNVTLTINESSATNIFADIATDKIFLVCQSGTGLGQFSEVDSYSTGGNLVLKEPFLVSPDETTQAALAWRPQTGIVVYNNLIEGRPEISNQIEGPGQGNAEQDSTGIVMLASCRDVFIDKNTLKDVEMGVGTWIGAGQSGGDPYCGSSYFMVVRDNYCNRALHAHETKGGSFNSRIATFANVYRNFTGIIKENPNSSWTTGAAIFNSPTVSGSNDDTISRLSDIFEHNVLSGCKYGVLLNERNIQNNRKDYKVSNLLFYKNDFTADPDLVTSGFEVTNGVVDRVLLLENKYHGFTKIYEFEDYFTGEIDTIGSELEVATRNLYIETNKTSTRACIKVYNLGASDNTFTTIDSESWFSTSSIYVEKESYAYLKIDIDTSSLSYGKHSGTISILGSQFNITITINKLIENVSTIKDGAFVIYKQDDANSEFAAIKYKTIHDIDGYRVLAIPCSDTEILENYNTYKTEVEDHILNGISIAGVDAKAIVIMNNVPGGYYDGDDIVSSTSRLSRIYHNREIKLVNNLFDRKVFQNFNTDDSEFAILSGRIDGPSVESINNNIDLMSRFNNQFLIDGKMFIDPYSDRHDTGAKDYENDMLDLVDRILPKINLEKSITTFLDPYIDVFIPEVKDDSFVWSWFTDRGSAEFFKDTKSVRTFFYNADYDSCFTLRDTSSRRWGALAAQAGYIGIGGAMSNPTIEGFLSPIAFFEALVEGATLGEAVLFSSPYVDWTTTFIGDPLAVPTFPATIPVDDDNVIEGVDKDETIRLLGIDLGKSLAHHYRKFSLFEDIRDIITASNSVSVSTDLLYLSQILLDNNKDETRHAEYSSLINGYFEFIIRTNEFRDLSSANESLNEYLSNNNYKLTELIPESSGLNSPISDSNLFEMGEWTIERVILKEQDDFTNYHFDLEVSTDASFSTVIISESSLENQEQWQYEVNENEFSTVPVNGVGSNFAGRRIRYNSDFDQQLTRGVTYYFRIRQRDLNQVFDFNSFTDVIFT